MPFQTPTNPRRSHPPLARVIWSSLMPMFDFECRKCGCQFEELVRRDETPACPQCQAKTVEKLMSAPAGHVAGGSSRSLPVMGQCAPPPGQHSCGSGCRHG